VYKPTTIALLAFADTLSAALAACAALSLADVLNLPHSQPGSRWVLVFVVTVLLCLLLFDCYRQLLRRSLFDVVFRVLGASGFAAVVWFFLGLAARGLERFRWQGRGFLPAIILTACAVLLVRLVFRAAAGEHEEPAPQGKAWRQS
jgi:FlaA1/EpsC-like NDP-sugar epimerase